MIGRLYRIAESYLLWVGPVEVMRDPDAALARVKADIVAEDGFVDDEWFRLEIEYEWDEFISLVVGAGTAEPTFSDEDYENPFIAPYLKVWKALTAEEQESARVWLQNHSY